ARRAHPGAQLVPRESSGAGAPRAGGRPAAPDDPGEHPRHLEQRRSLPDRGGDDAVRAARPGWLALRAVRRLPLGATRSAGTPEPAPARLSTVTVPSAFPGRVRVGAKKNATRRYGLQLTGVIQRAFIPP